MCYRFKCQRARIFAIVYISFTAEKYLVTFLLLLWLFLLKKITTLHLVLDANFSPRERKCRFPNAFCMINIYHIHNTIILQPNRIYIYFSSSSWAYKNLNYNYHSSIANLKPMNETKLAFFFQNVQMIGTIYYSVLCIAKTMLFKYIIFTALTVF